MAKSATEAASDNTHRVAAADRSDVAELREMFQPLLKVDEFGADDSSRFRPAVRVASYDQKPTAGGVEPERRAFLPMALLEGSVARWGDSSPEPASYNMPTTPRQGERTAMFQAEPPLAEPPVAEPPLAEPPVADRPAAEPRAAEPPAADADQLGPFEVTDHEDELTVVLRRSKLLRTKVDVYRTAVVDPSVCDVVQFTPREVSVIGKGQGATHVTFWLQDDRHRPVTYLVRVTPDPEVQQRREAQYAILEEVLAELFPESKVKLITVADKLIVKGQARDAEEAARILAVIRGQAVLGPGVVEGRASDPPVRRETNRQLAAPQVINLLRISAVHPAALGMKIIGPFGHGN